jgi:hypothetical protein
VKASSRRALTNLPRSLWWYLIDKKDGGRGGTRTPRRILPEFGANCFEAFAAIGFHSFLARNAWDKWVNIMYRPKIILCFVLIGLGLIACGKKPEPQKTESPAKQVATSQPSSNDSATPASNGVTSPESPVSPPPTGKGVKAEMHNVIFRLMPKAGAHLETLSGELWPTGKNEMPVFDDKSSFEVRVNSGKVSATPEALSAVMNDYVFAKPDAPMKELQVTIQDEKLHIKGKLHAKGDLPFETIGTLSVNPDGRLRVRTEKVKALHLNVKKVMNVFGIELASLLSSSKILGISVDKDDLIMDLGELLPPPHIRGKVSAVQVTGNSILIMFGDGGKSPSSEEKGSYMQFEGNRVQFGKITMDNTDLTILDMDPGDPLDWSQDSYREQLVQGYARLNENFGLRAYVKDYSKLLRNPAAKESAVAKPRLQ